MAEFENFRLQILNCTSNKIEQSKQQGWGQILKKKQQLVR